MRGIWMKIDNMDFYCIHTKCHDPACSLLTLFVYGPDAFAYFQFFFAHSVEGLSRFCLQNVNVSAAFVGR